MNMKQEEELNMTTAIMTNKHFGIYVRTACKEDPNKQQNRIQKLTEYLAKHNLIKMDEFVDDGFSGMDMNRPALNQLLKAIENKEVDGIIVEDLSHLGRDNDKVSDFINAYCKGHQIRFISVNNQMDTAYSLNTEFTLIYELKNHLKEPKFS